MKVYVIEDYEYDTMKIIEIHSNKKKAEKRKAEIIKKNWYIELAEYDVIEPDWNLPHDATKGPDTFKDLKKLG